MGNLAHVEAEIYDSKRPITSATYRQPNAIKMVALRVIDTAGYPVYEFAFDSPGDEAMFVRGELVIKNITDSKIIRINHPSGYDTSGARIYLDYKHVAMKSPMTYGSAVNLGNMGINSNMNKNLEYRQTLGVSPMNNASEREWEMRQQRMFESMRMQADMMPYRPLHPWASNEPDKKEKKQDLIILLL